MVANIIQQLDNLSLDIKEIVRKLTVFNEIV